MILDTKNSKVNGKLDVVWELGWGKHIKAGGLTQSGGVAELIWSDTLKKIRNKNQKIEKVLILGLGGGSIAKLTRKFWQKSKIIGVEIDPFMVEMGSKHLGLSKTGVKVKIDDALEYCKKCKDKFDLICIDTYVGDQFPKKFEDEKFLKLIIILLSKNGMAVFNRLYFDEKRSEAVRFGEKLQKIFSKVEYVYPEANLMFICNI